jgi:hypothetical protein
MSQVMTDRILYTPELATAICLDIATGMSVAAASQNNGVTDRAFYLWLTKHEDLVQKYGRAREIRADARFESSTELMNELRHDVIDSNKARIMLDELKWKCGKENAKKYGDSQQIKHADADGNKLLTAILGTIDGRTAGLPEDTSHSF